MNCPMSFNSNFDPQGIGGVLPCTCDGSCAWWVYHTESQGYCAITSIALNLQELMLVIQEKNK